ncbi:MAG: 4Fe-4S binding protein [Dehalococcoidales bacterium]|nr:4Fe-4S binding protein [Dehalococcoidales bacterium]
MDSPKAEAKAKGRIEIDRERCKGCELCVSVCPNGSICISAKLNATGYLPAEFKDTGSCTGCATCALVCPEVAIEVYRA